MNWGHKITLAFILFAVFILYMVSKMMQTKVDLVEEDYYAKELAFQDKINQSQNLSALGDSAVMVYQYENEIIVEWKKSFPIKGQLWFYYPSNNAFDKVFSIKNKLSDNYWKMSKNQLHKGRSILKLEWEDDKGKAYYFEKELFIY
ncbi:MAG: FixH family protein [Bacteroidota bacterium]